MGWISQARAPEWVAVSSSGDTPDPGIEPASLHWQADPLPLNHLESLRGDSREKQWL